jgi:ESX secretion system ATPase EccB
MQTKKDLLQAHRLMTQRASQALLLGEPDTPELPLRRLNVATFCGVMVVILVMAAYGIWGLLTHSGAKVEQAGLLIIEKETGARYVWCGNGHKLCPVLNYSSAKLLAGGGQTLVSRDSLSTYERGPLLGIPGAPDTLPDPKKLVKMPWSVCVRAVDSPLSGHISTVTLVAGRPVGGQSLPAGRAILVRSDGQPWLIWRDMRMRVPPNEVSGLSPTVSPAQIADKWLNALPEGSDFKAPDIPGRGQIVPGPESDAPVGQLYTADTVSGTAWYVLMRDGLARISEIEGQLMKLDPAAKGSANPKSLDPATLANAPKHQGNITSNDLQAKTPTIVPYTDTSPLCAVYNDQTGNTGAHLTIGAQLPAPPQTTAGGAANIDQLVFPPGGAALVGVLPSQGRAAAVSTFYLVTEGRRFALQSTDVAQKLGYVPQADAIAVPANVVALIPNGPLLDPTAAAREVDASQITSTPPPG